MSKGFTRLIWIVACIIGVHGYMYLATEQVHPCKAAEVRLVQEYGPAVVLALGVSELVEPMVPADKRADNPLYRDPKVREAIERMRTVRRWGAPACYMASVLGWWSVPPTPLPGVRLTRDEACGRSPPDERKKDAERAIAHHTEVVRQHPGDAVPTRTAQYLQGERRLRPRHHRLQRGDQATPKRRADIL